MNVKQRLNKDIHQFLRFIDVGETTNTIQTNLIRFFEESAGPAYVVHDCGDIYYYSNDRLIGFDSVNSEGNTGSIHTFDGRKTTIISPYSDDSDRTYQMKSGGSGKGKRRRGSSSDISSNNNNNNNNNNNG